MAAIPKWATLHQSVINDVRAGAPYAHLEPGEVPQWTEESDEGIVCAMAHAITDIDEGDKLAELLTALCKQGEKMPLEDAMDLLAMLRTGVTTYCIAQAQKHVDDELFV